MDTPTSYDEFRYPGRPYPQALPDRLATLARLSGMQPADPVRSRVLELGCGEGANLLQVAYAWPGARAVGIDLAATSITRGRELAATLGLANVDLRVGDVMRLPDDLGEFDYVIAHGVYSWVPDAVREGLLAACRRHLAPQGVAYVSYNVLPGGHVRRMLREMLLMHVEEIEEPDRRCAAAREFLAFLAEAYAGPRSRPDAVALAREAERLAGRSDWSLFHDDLSPVFHLCHFRDFVVGCEAQGLRFVAEADYSEMSDAGLPAPAREHLARLAGDLVAREQYLDFVKVRRFRQSLLCRSEVELSDAGAAAVRGMSLATRARRDTSAGEARGDEWQFRTPSGASFETRSPLFKAAMELLANEWPKAVAFEDLLAASAAVCGLPATAEARELLAEMALRTHAVGAVELNACQPPFARRPGPRPRASALARLQAREGDVVTNLLGASVTLDDPLARPLLDRLDGRTERTQLLRTLGGSPEVLEHQLETLGRFALLLAD